MSYEQQVIKEARAVLVGRIVKDIVYMTDEELAGTGWKRGPVIVFDDDSMMYAMSDDEGNDSGVLYYDQPRRDYTLQMGSL